MGIVRKLVRTDLNDELATRFNTAAQVACDVETSGLDPNSDTIGTVQLHSREIGTVIIQATPMHKPINLCALLSNQRIMKVFHHAMFDLRFMVAHWGIEPRNIGCTKVASKLLKPTADRSSHSLQYLLESRLGIIISKDQQISDWMAYDLTLEQIEYACGDVEHLLPLLENLSKELRSRDLHQLFERCTSFIPTRVSLDLGGWPDVFSY